MNNRHKLFALKQYKFEKRAYLIGTQLFALSNRQVLVKRDEKVFIYDLDSQAIIVQKTMNGFFELISPDEFIYGNKDKRFIVKGSTLEIIREIQPASHGHLRLNEQTIIGYNSGFYYDNAAKISVYEPEFNLKMSESLCKVIDPAKIRDLIKIDKNKIAAISLDQKVITLVEWKDNNFINVGTIKIDAEFEAINYIFGISNNRIIICTEEHDSKPSEKTAGEDFYFNIYCIDTATKERLYKRHIVINRHISGLTMMPDENTFLGYDWSHDKMYVFDMVLGKIFLIPTDLFLLSVLPNGHIVTFDRCENITEYTSEYINELNSVVANQEKLVINECFANSFMSVSNIIQSYVGDDTVITPQV